MIWWKFFNGMTMHYCDKNHFDQNSLIWWKFTILMKFHHCGAKKLFGNSGRGVYGTLASSKIYGRKFWPEFTLWDKRKATPLMFFSKKPPIPDFAWFTNFLKTTSKYPFLKAILSKVEFIMVCRWVCLDLIYCHPSSNSSIIRKISFTHLCVYQKTTDNYQPLHY